MPTADQPEKPSFGAVTRFAPAQIPQFVKNSRKVFHNQGILIKRAPAQYPYGRILTIIPNAVGPAPLRNLLRRRIKAIFFEQKLYQSPYDYGVWMFKEAALTDFDTLQTILRSVCQ